MRSVVNRSGPGRSRGRRRAVAVGLVSAAVVAVMIDPGPAQAATIPTPPAVCKASTSPGDPVLTSLKITPTSVNVKTADKKFAVSVHATDSTKSIRSISVYLQSPTIHGVSRYSFATLKLGKNQDAKNGNWSGTATIRRWTNNGTWKVAQVYLVDAGGGSTFYSPDFSTSGHTWGSAWPKTVSVLSTPDTTPPTIKLVSVSPATVDTSSATKKVTITVKAADTQSGVRAVYAQGSVVIKGRSYAAYGFNFKKTAGTPKNGTWKGTLTVPRWVTKGPNAWDLQVSAADHADQYGNSVNKTFKKKFKVKSRTDATKPALKALTYAPHSVNALAANKKVAFTLKATDTLSGLAYVYVTIKSPSGITSTGYLARKAGTAFNGTFKGSVVVPRCGEPGTWTVSAQLVDVAGNLTAYTAAQLKAKKFSSTLTVKDIDTVGPIMTTPAKTPTSGITLTFSEATLWKDSAANTLQVYDYSKSFSALTGTWTCKNTAGTTVACDANGANVKSATFAPTSAFGHGDSVYVQPKNVYPTPVGIYDTTGNPMTSGYASSTVS